MARGAAVAVALLPAVFGDVLRGQQLEHALEVRRRLSVPYLGSRAIVHKNQRQDAHGVLSRSASSVKRFLGSNLCCITNCLLCETACPIVLVVLIPVVSQCFTLDSKSSAIYPCMGIIFTRHWDDVCSRRYTQNASLELGRVRHPHASSCCSDRMFLRALLGPDWAATRTP